MNVGNLKQFCFLFGNTLSSFCPDTMPVSALIVTDSNAAAVHCSIQMTDEVCYRHSFESLSSWSCWRKSLLLNVISEHFRFRKTLKTWVGMANWVGYYLTEVTTFSSNCGSSSAKLTTLEQAFKRVILNLYEVKNMLKVVTFSLFLKLPQVDTHSIHKIYYFWTKLKGPSLYKKTIIWVRLF